MSRVNVYDVEIAFDSYFCRICKIAAVFVHQNIAPADTGRQLFKGDAAGFTLFIFTNRVLYRLSAFAASAFSAGISAAAIFSAFRLFRLIRYDHIACAVRISCIAIIAVAGSAVFICVLTA